MAYGDVDWAYGDVDCPPKYDGLNFSIWKVKMIVFLESFRSRVAKDICKQFVKPVVDEDTLSKTAVKEYEVNAKAKYALIEDLNDDDLSQVINCTSAYDI